MPNLLEITGDDIANLADDACLRELIGLLCEADYRSAGLPTKDILWGGNQDARDGGLDVVVRGEVEPPRNSHIPRKITGFQVKKPCMPRNKILEEMRPKGILRAAIKGLMETRGAYIIVSATDSTTAEEALPKRIDAMKEAVSTEKNHNNLLLDFYDRGRIATWVRSHPSLVIWVQNKMGGPIAGWRPYENWADSPGGIEEDFLLDEGLRIHDETMHRRCGGISVEDGMLRLRTLLSRSGTAVRLLGQGIMGFDRRAVMTFATGIKPSLIFALRQLLRTVQ